MFSIHKKVSTFMRVSCGYDKNIAPVFWRPKRSAENAQYYSVWVLSTGRVGSMTLAKLLRNSRTISVHEPSPLLFNLGKLAYHWDENNDCVEVIREAIKIAREESVKYAQRQGRMYVETSPQVTFLAYALIKAFPNAFFIHVYRNPLDVVRSGLRRGWYAGHSCDKYRIVPKNYKIDNLEWDRASLIMKNLWLWYETNNWIMKFADQHQDRSIRVKSEDLFTLKTGTLKKIESHLGIKFNERKAEKIVSTPLNVQKRGEAKEIDEWNKLEIQYYENKVLPLLEKLNSSQ